MQGQRIAGGEEAFFIGLCFVPLSNGCFARAESVSSTWSVKTVT